MSENPATQSGDMSAGGKDAAASKARLRLWLKLLKATKHVEAELRENFRTVFNTGDVPQLRLAQVCGISAFAA